MPRFLTREEQAKVKNGEAIGLSFAKTRKKKKTAYTIADKLLRLDKVKSKKGKKSKRKKPYKWISVVSVPFGGMNK